MAPDDALFLFPLLLRCLLYFAWFSQDFIICVITSEEDAVCSDRSPVSTRKTPDLDDQDDPYFEVTRE